MKDCCEINKDKHKKSTSNRIINYIIYALLTSIILWALSKQIVDNSLKQKNEGVSEKPIRNQ